MLNLFYYFVWLILYIFIFRCSSHNKYLSLICIIFYSKKDTASSINLVNNFKPLVVYRCVKEICRDRQLLWKDLILLGPYFPHYSFLLRFYTLGNKSLRISLIYYNYLVCFQGLRPFRWCKYFEAARNYINNIMLWIYNTLLSLETFAFQ